jgi:hypothetical protein
MLSSSTKPVTVIVPSLKDPYCTVPLNVAPTPDEILPEAILNVPSVTVPPSTVPDAVMLPTCGLSTSPTWIWLFVTAVSISLAVPAIVSVSPPFTVSFVPLSAAISKLVEIELLLTAVICP